MEISIGLQVTKQTPVNKGDCKQLIFALRETVGWLLRNEYPSAHYVGYDEWHNDAQFIRGIAYIM